MKLILEAVMGSKAYGLDTPESDTDLKGVFVASTEEVLSLHPVKETIDRTDPDVCYHEVEKFIRLALKGNPTIIEQLFATEYTQLTWEGQILVDNRDKFLSNIVRESYGGYAYSQAMRLQKREGESFSSQTKNRYAKHARHCFRLLQQGAELMETGKLTLKVKNRDELFAIGKMKPADLVKKFEEEYASFKEIKSVLPDKPETGYIDGLLLGIRFRNFGDKKMLEEYLHD